MPIYTEEELDLRKSGEKQFDYVDPRNRELQIEMEAACTNHLKLIDAYIASDCVSEVAIGRNSFPLESSVIVASCFSVMLAETLAVSVFSIARLHALPNASDAVSTNKTHLFIIYFFIG